MPASAGAKSFFVLIPDTPCIRSWSAEEGLGSDRISIWSDPFQSWRFEISSGTLASIDPLIITHFIKILDGLLMMTARLEKLIRFTKWFSRILIIGSFFLNGSGLDRWNQSGSALLWLNPDIQLIMESRIASDSLT